MYSYTYKISLDDKTRIITSFMEDAMTEDELKFDAFIRHYEKEFGACIEWEADELVEHDYYEPANVSQLRGETLEIFNRFQFEMIDLSEKNQPMPKLKRKRKSF